MHLAPHGHSSCKKHNHRKTPKKEKGTSCCPGVKDVKPLILLCVPRIIFVPVQRCTNSQRRAELYLPSPEPLSGSVLSPTVCPPTAASALGVHLTPHGAGGLTDSLSEIQRFTYRLTELSVLQMGLGVQTSPCLLPRPLAAGRSFIEAASTPKPTLVCSCFNNS